MIDNFRTLISAILAKVSALYPKKSDVYTKQETDSKIKSSTPSVPTKLTQLTNDAGFITADEVPEVPTINEIISALPIYNGEVEEV
jgi:hypothetical protein